MHSKKLIKLKYLLFDLHGVVITQQGKENAEIAGFEASLADNVSHAEKLGIGLGIITASDDIGLLETIRSFGIREIYSHSIAKLDQAEKFLIKQKLDFEDIGYIGDDILDIPLLMKAGFSGAPRLARREVKRVVDFVGKSSNEKTIITEILELIEKVKKEK